MNNTKFYLLMFFSMLLWAGSWVSGKLVTGDNIPQVLMFWRFSMSFVSFIPLAYWERKKKLSQNPSYSVKALFRQGGKKIYLSLLATSVSLVIYNYAFFVGLDAGLAGKGGVIVTSINPLFGFIIGVLFFKAKMNKKQSLGLLIGVCGGILLMEPWRYSFTELLDGGNFIFLGAALCWATLTALSHLVQNDLPLMTFNICLYGLASVICGLLAWDQPLFELSRYSTSFWVNTAYLAVFAGAIATGIYFYASSVIGSVKAGSFTFLVPGLAILLSYFILGEALSLITICGGLIAYIAVIMVNKGGKSS